MKTVKMKPFENCTKLQKIRRWQHALRVLQNLTPHQRHKHWEMFTFGYKSECGTIACAAGHCSLDPWFRRRGFIGTFNRDGQLKGPGRRLLGNMAETFFGIAGCEAIFFNTAQRPVGAVIKEIRAYIRTIQ